MTECKVKKGSQLDGSNAYYFESTILYPSLRGVLAITQGALPPLPLLQSTILVLPSVASPLSIHPSISSGMKPGLSPRPCPLTSPPPLLPSSPLAPPAQPRILLATTRGPIRKNRSNPAGTFTVIPDAARDDGRWPCNMTGCSKSFSRRTYRTRHERNVHKARIDSPGHEQNMPKGRIDFPCEVTCCSATLSNDIARMTHMRTVHEELRAWKCEKPGCGWAFERKQDLEKHILAVHEGRRDFQCDVIGCGKRFAQKYNWGVHRRTVHKEPQDMAQFVVETPNPLSSSRRASTLHSVSQEMSSWSATSTISIPEPVLKSLSMSRETPVLKGPMLKGPAISNKASLISDHLSSQLNLDAPKLWNTHTSTESPGRESFIPKPYSKKLSEILAL